MFLCAKFSKRAKAAQELATTGDPDGSHGNRTHSSGAACGIASTDAQLPGTMSSGDVNGDSVNDFAYEFPAGTFNVHFGGISADLDLDSITYDGSNGFSIVTGNSGNIWGTIAGDVNQDGFVVLPQGKLETQERSSQNMFNTDSSLVL